MILMAMKLLVAHLFGDFLFFPNSWKANIKQAGIRSSYLYLHTLLHALLALVILFDINFWPVVLAIFTGHLAIPLVGRYLSKWLTARWAFALEQTLFISLTLGLTSFYFPLHFDLARLISPHILVFLLAILMITVVSSEIMKQLMSQWTLEEDDQNDSLKNAGSVIGMLERMFVFGFIILGQWQAIGLLIAAKSVFRFGDLSRAKDRKLTEYILIGTMLSFGLAILIGLGYQYTMTHLANQPA